LQRHAHVHDEIEAFKSDMKKLDEQSQLMNETSQSKEKDNKQVLEILVFFGSYAERTN
jgi:hypothetical protein